MLYRGASRGCVARSIDWTTAGESGAWTIMKGWGLACFADSVVLMPIYINNKLLTMLTMLSVAVDIRKLIKNYKAVIVLKFTVYQFKYLNLMKARSFMSKVKI